MKRLKEIIESRSPQAQLARVGKRQMGRNLGIITAHRDDYAGVPHENEKRNAALAQDIRAHGLGFIRTRGGSIENKGTPAEKNIKGEHGFMLIGRKGDDSGHMKGFLRKHGEKYGQSSVLFKPHDSSNARLIGTSKNAHGPDYGKEQDVGTFHPNKVADFYSQITKGKKNFTYEEFEFYSNPTFFRREERILTLEEVEAILNGDEYTAIDISG